MGHLNVLSFWWSVLLSDWYGIGTSPPPPPSPLRLVPNQLWELLWTLSLSELHLLQQGVGMLTQGLPNSPQAPSLCHCTTETATARR